MKLDLVVYGRGQERSEGFQHFARPSYWTDDMLITMSRFNELWTGGDLRENCPRAYIIDRNPWSKTFMFICQPPPYCCALLRCTRVEGDEPGTWLKEVRNYDIWSMEGLCCPYEQREKFFALLPSILLWFEQDSSSLYGRLRHKTAGDFIELPEDQIYDPYAVSEEPPDVIYDLILDDSARSAWVDLWYSVRFAAKPFQFLFGPLADHFNDVIGAYYGIKENFCSMWKTPRDFSDPFERILPIEARNPSKNIVSYRLRLKVGSDRGGGLHRQWGIYELSDEVTDNDALRSGVTDEEDSIELTDLVSEAEAIRSFVRQLGWTVADQEGTEEQFTFKKEE